MNPFIQGLAIGLAIAAPVGPIGLLCIRRTLAQGPTMGLATGLGAATADAAYGLVAVFGVALAATLLAHEAAFRLVGAGLLAWLAWGTWRARPAEDAARAPDATGLLTAWAGTTALTLANPATILSFAGVIAALGPEGASTGGLHLVAGVFLGSAAWWLGLSGVVGRLRTRVTPAAMVWINRASALVLAGFAAAALWPVVAG